MSHTNVSTHNDGNSGSHLPSDEGTPNVPEASATGSGTDTDSDDGWGSEAEEVYLLDEFGDDYEDDQDLWEKLPDDNPTKKRLMSVKLTCEHRSVCGKRVTPFLAWMTNQSRFYGIHCDEHLYDCQKGKDTELCLSIWDKLPDDDPMKQRFMSKKLTCTGRIVCGKSLTPFLTWMTDQHHSCVDGLGYRCYKHLCDCQKGKDPEFCGACYKECCGECAKGCDCLD